MHQFWGDSNRDHLYEHIVSMVRQWMMIFKEYPSNYSCVERAKYTNKRKKCFSSNCSKGCATYRTMSLARFLGSNTQYTNHRGLILLESKLFSFFVCSVQKQKVVTITNLWFSAGALLNTHCSTLAISWSLHLFFCLHLKEQNYKGDLGKKKDRKNTPPLFPTKPLS